jgi:hypothetical protein
LVGYVIRFVNKPPRKVTPEEWHAEPVELPIGREQLGALLRVAVHGPSQPGDLRLDDPSVEDIAALGARAAPQIHWMHALERAGWRHHAYVLGFDGFFALIAGLLMNAEIRDEVAQCRYAECAKFFRVEKAPQGRPQRLYCCEDHRTAANNEGSRDRQRARRQRARVTRALLDTGKPRVKAREAAAQAFKELNNATDEALIRRAKAILKSRGTKS